jgi:tetratricopeptide (TPR) repeat protein
MTPSGPGPAIDQLLREGDALYVAGNLRPARERYEAAARQAPDRPELHYRMACCAWGQGQTDAARSHFGRAIELNPNYGDAHEGLGQLLMETGDLQAADVHSARAVELSPQDPDAAVSRAFVLQAADNTQAAWPIVQELIARGQITGRLGVVFSRIAPKLKREQEALDILGRVLAAGKLNPREERGLRFAAAALLDRLARYDEAFLQSQIANRLRAAQARYDPQAVEQNINRLIAYFTPQKLASLARASHASKKLIFIVGMPRSGTSLVEQILASHPQVRAGGELPHLPRVVEATPRVIGASQPYPQCLDRLTLPQANELAAMYINAGAAGALTGGTGAATIQSDLHFTDKLPFNFLHLGLIQLLFPQAKVIHCVRDAQDVCLSCFMTDFASGNEFSFDLAHAGHFYRQYERLMAHWRAVLDLPMLDVSYEQVVGDLEPQARRLLEFLDLPWDPACLNFHQSKRYVWTASSEQVRRPIYKSSIERWRKYEKHLGELKKLMNDK